MSKKKKDKKLKTSKKDIKKKIDNIPHLDEDVIFTANRITNLVFPYINDYLNNITGIYLSPYKIGENEHIEIVIVNNGTRELPILTSQSSINNIQLCLTITEQANYKLNSRKEDEKCIKNLKTGCIVYDPKTVLSKLKKKIQEHEEITSFYNSSTIPSELVQEVKVMLLSRE